LRTQLHTAAGAAIEHSDEDNTDALALHFSRAGDAVRTWRYARIAAAHARKSYANVDAARYYEMALAAAKHLPGLDRRDHIVHGKGQMPAFSEKLKSSEIALLVKYIRRFRNQPVITQAQKNQGL